MTVSLKNVKLYLFLCSTLPAIVVSITPARSGSCPPALPVSVCTNSCDATSCSPPELCCPSSCGGTVCTQPVTKRRFAGLVKPGVCPEQHPGPWICSSTCTGDSDCRRKLKCCPNRCGAKVCTKASVPVDPAWVGVQPETEAREANVPPVQPSAPTVSPDSMVNLPEPVTTSSGSVSDLN